MDMSEVKALDYELPKVELAPLVLRYRLAGLIRLAAARGVPQFTGGYYRRGGELCAMAAAYSVAPWASEYSGDDTAYGADVRCWAFKEFPKALVSFVTNLNDTHKLSFLQIAEMIER
jgi:hypothetical protein